MKYWQTVIEFIAGFSTAGQRRLNIIFFTFFLLLCGLQTYAALGENRLGLTELIFIIHNLVFAGVFLTRKPVKALSESFKHQAVALAAFFSGPFFIGPAVTNNPACVFASEIITAAALLLGMATLLNLGKSFGVMVAVRELKSRGLYGVVRHPMYATDIMMRLGYLITHAGIFNVCLVLFSSACYIWRAVLEESFWQQHSDYQEYMQKVPYRFIPRIF
ncbi:MAG: hypothetical protein LBJ14_05925 [Desulfarculales bacterium]|jgi:protein-S-isoprenylcysteine O-methyltransferase Ste14|nr:hypothetical protein [Desulfarculales bacterium]